MRIDFFTRQIFIKLPICWVCSEIENSRLKSIISVELSLSLEEKSLDSGRNELLFQFAKKFCSRKIQYAYCKL